jgi:hypothetical protein
VRAAAPARHLRWIKGEDGVERLEPLESLNRRPKREEAKD